MFHLREIDYEKDLRMVSALLARSLGVHFTEDVFLWKHSRNPFGRSFGLLAFDGEQLVGVRMFMNWQFTNGVKTVKAIRPVDTATLESYRGKGIFKQLTLEGLRSSVENYELVFNTPNKNSLPGYLKMGWSRVEGPLVLKLAVVNSFGTVTPVRHLSAKEIEWDHKNNNAEIFSTHRSSPFLRWRYENDAYKVACGIIDGKKQFIIYRREKIKGFACMVICELLCEEQNRNVLIRSLSKEIKTKLLYYLEEKQGPSVPGLFSWKRSQPVAVYRDDQYSIIPKVAFTLGDLEGRL